MYSNKGKLNLNAPSFMPRKHKQFENELEVFISDYNKFDEYNSLNSKTTIPYQRPVESEVQKTQNLLSNFSPTPLKQENEPIYEINSKIYIKTIILNLGFYFDDISYKKITNSAHVKEMSNRIVKTPDIKDYFSYLNGDVIADNSISSGEQNNLPNDISPPEPLLIEKECSICLEYITKEKKYGLLINCSHVFCFCCIKQWRKDNHFRDKKNAIINQSINKYCPLCKEESAFIIPSDFYTSKKEKKIKLAEEYKRKLCLIPCKFYYKTKDCPYGNTCFYSHV